MNNESKTLRCEIVEDLLPLYHDGVVNVITAEAVEEHLKECELCKKEYESISADIGEKKEKSTKEAFTIMIKKKRIKQVLLTAFACVISCCILSGSWTFLNHACVFEQKDVKVERVYRYRSTDGEDKFFVELECSPGRSISVDYKDEDGVKVCEATIRAPFIPPSKEEYNWNSVILISAENKETGIYSDELKIGEITAWTKEGNANDEVPAYVYAYDLYENSNNDEFGDSDTCGWSWYGNTATIEHAKYGRLTWNMDGKLIEGSPETEKEILDLYK